MSNNLADKMQAAFGRFQAQDFAGAEQLCVEILRDSPRNSDAMHLLGVVRLATGSAGEAVSLISGALEGKPRDPVALEHLGLARAALGDYAAAEAAFRQAIALGGQHGLLQMRLGMALAAQGRTADALVMLRNAAASAPGIPDVHLNLGNLLAQQGQPDEALACYNKVLAIRPDHAAARFNIGNLYAGMGRLDDAAAAFQRVLASDPDDADARNNLGIVYQRQGKLDDAAASYRRALESNPRHAQTWHNIGTLHSERGVLQDAVAAYRKSLEINPAQASVHNDLGSALRDSGDLESAIAAYRGAIAVDPHSAGAFYNLAETLKVQGKLDDALDSYERALALKPDHASALGGTVHVRQHVCDWRGIEESWRRVREAIATGTGGLISPFSVMSMPTSPAEQFACARAWVRRELGSAVVGQERAFDHSVRGKRGRLRIGYLSWGFHRHATAYLTAQLFELHRRDRFEVSVYAYGPDDNSAIRARIRSACEHFVDISRESNSAAAKRIHDDGVDILVDLTGHTLGARLPILALRPAPVQVNWLGYPGTMGADCIDYLIADPFIIPAQQEPFYSEKVIRLPDCYQMNDRLREVSDRVPSREECGLPGDALVFCCFNQAYKILPETFDRWMRILRAVPKSVLWLAEANRWATENLRRAAAERGVAPERLVFAARRNLPDYLVQYRLADLALDTFPYTSHTTASDALWMGCPLVTSPGETFASRVAGSILVSAGLRELVADSAADCERKVLELATTPGRLRDLRRRLQETRDGCPLFDTPRFVRNLESIYEGMFKDFLERGPASR